MSVTMASDNAIELPVGPRTVRISNPDRVYFSARQETKLDLANYYISVGDGIVRALGERPCMLHRFPDGVDGPKVHEKRDLGRQRSAQLRADRAALGLRRGARGGARVRARGRAADSSRRHDDLVAQGPPAGQGVRGLQPERARPHHRERVLGSGQPGGNRLNPNLLGRARQCRPARVHDRDGPSPVCADRKSPRRDRRVVVLAPASARMGAKQA
jgi:hypothetical protein